MAAKQVQIVITLPLKLKLLAEEKAASFGVGLDFYILHLTMKDVGNQESSRGVNDERYLPRQMRSR